MSSSTAADLAGRVEGAYQAFGDYLSGLTPEQWRTRCGNHPTIRMGDEDESRPVGTVAYHTAAAPPRMLVMVRAIRDGAEVPRPDRARNAQQALEHPDPDQPETVALARRNGAEAAAVIRSLSDDDLAVTGPTPFGEVSVADFVRRVLVGHVMWHEGSIRATVGHPLPPGEPRPSPAAQP